MIEWIKNLRSTEKGRTLFKFILYMFFFVIVLILVVIANGMDSPYIRQNNSTNISKESSTQKKELTYFEKQRILLEGKYDFIYNIEGPININYMGTYNNKNVEGFKESEDNLIRYSIENGIIYKKSLTSKSEYDELYIGLEENLFDLENIFLKLNSNMAVIRQEEDKKIYEYELDNKKYKVTTDYDGIIEITITFDVYTYKYTFQY